MCWASCGWHWLQLAHVVTTDRSLQTAICDQGHAHARILCLAKKFVIALPSSEPITDQLLLKGGTVLATSRYLRTDSTCVEDPAELFPTGDEDQHDKFRISASPCPAQQVPQHSQHYSAKGGSTDMKLIPMEGAKRSRRGLCVRLPSVSKLKTMQSDIDIYSSGASSAAEAAADGALAGDVSSPDPGRVVDVERSLQFYQGHDRLSTSPLPGAISSGLGLDFYPAGLSLDSETIVRDMREDWRAGIEQRHQLTRCDTRTEQLRTAGTINTTIRGSTARRRQKLADYVSLAESLFTRPKNTRKHKHSDAVVREKASKETIPQNSTLTSRVTDGVCQPPSSMAITLEAPRATSAPPDCCGRAQFRNRAYSLLYLCNMEAPRCTSPPPGVAMKGVLSLRPYSTLTHEPGVLTAHRYFLSQARRRAVRALNASLHPGEPVVHRKAEADPSVPQLADSGGLKYSVLNGKIIPIVYTSDDEPLVAKIRNQFSYTDLYFSFCAPPGAVNRRASASVPSIYTQRNQIIDTIGAQKASEPPTQLLRQPTASRLEATTLPRDSHSTGTKVSASLLPKRRIRTDRVSIAAPLAASASRNVLSSPISWSSSDADCMSGKSSCSEDAECTHITEESNVPSNSVAMQRAQVLSNDRLRGILSSLRQLEDMRGSRRVVQSLTTVEINAALHKLQGHSTSPKARGASQLRSLEATSRNRSPRRGSPRSELYNTLHLNDLLTSTNGRSSRQQSDDSNDSAARTGDGHNNHGNTMKQTIKPISSLLPPTAKNSRFFTFNA